MPKTRFDKVPRDPLKELVLGRKTTLGISGVTLAEKTHMSTTRLFNLLNANSNTWRVSDVLAFSAALDIPMAEMREVIGKR